MNKNGEYSHLKRTMLTVFHVRFVFVLFETLGFCKSVRVVFPDLENFKILYDPNIVVHHPTGIIYEKSFLLKKTYSYARGLGYLMQKHKMPLLYKSYQLFRPILGMIVNVLCMDWYKVRKSYYNFRGRIEGLFIKF